jgi:hypothetical protein
MLVVDDLCRMSYLNPNLTDIVCFHINVLRLLEYRQPFLWPKYPTDACSMRNDAN